MQEFKIDEIRGFYRMKAFQSANCLCIIISTDAPEKDIKTQ